MPQIRNKWLRNLFEEAEFDREHEEVKMIEQTIRSLVEEISKSIAEKDPLFKNTVLRSGSFYGDLKVDGPNEFDLMICLEELSEPGVCQIKAIPFRSVPDPGYVHLLVQDPTFQEPWIKYSSKRKQTLKPKMLLERFKELVDESLTEKKTYFPEMLDQQFSTELRKTPVTVHFVWRGTKYYNFNIDINLVLCVTVSGWPSGSSLNDPRFTRTHPGYNAMEEATQTGYHLVASCIGESGAPRPCWRVSFSKAEGIILKHIFKNLTLVHREVVKILKVVRKKNESALCLFEENEQPDFFEGGDILFELVRDTSYIVAWAFHSYVLKTMFLQEWFEFPEGSFWTEDKLGQRICSVLQRIHKSLLQKDIRSFWLPDYKLFNFHARKTARTGQCEDKVSSLIDQFKRF